MSRAPWHDDDRTPPRRWRAGGRSSLARRLAWIRGELADAERGGRVADAARWQAEIDAATGKVDRRTTRKVDTGGDRPTLTQTETEQTPVPTQEEK